MHCRHLKYRYHFSRYGEMRDRIAEREEREREERERELEQRERYERHRKEW